MIVNNIARCVLDTTAGALISCCSWCTRKKDNKCLEIRWWDLWRDVAIRAQSSSSGKYSQSVKRLEPLIKSIRQRQHSSTIHSTNIWRTQVDTGKMIIMTSMLGDNMKQPRVTTIETNWQTSDRPTTRVRSIIGM